jgi:hypothetical protein
MMAGDEIRMEVAISSISGITVKCLECRARANYPRAAVAAADAWCRNHVCKPKGPAKVPAPVIQGELIPDGE